MLSSSSSATTFKFLRSDIVALHPQVKKAFFANLAAGIQYLKEVKQQSAVDPDDPTTRHTVLRQLSHAHKVSLPSRRCLCQPHRVLTSG